MPIFWQETHKNLKAEICTDRDRRYIVRTLATMLMSSVPDSTIHDCAVPAKALIKVVSSEFYFHKPITVHIELYLFYCFIHFLLYIGQY